MIAYEQYGYAAVAVIGTALAVWALAYAMNRPTLMRRFAPAQGVVGPFINVLGVLFGLTLAFIGNDTWAAHDKAVGAVFREADGMRAVRVLARNLPAPLDAQVGTSLEAYGQAVVAEWPSLGQRKADPDVTVAGDTLLAEVARPAVAEAAGQNLHAVLLDKVLTIRGERDLRVSLSQTHLNPLKWLGMAFLGFMTLIAIAVEHLDKPRAGIVALIIFATAAAPSAAIVLVQGNPFQLPAAVSPQPILDVLGASVP